MRKLKVAGLVLLIIVIVLVAIFAFIYFFRPQKTGLVIDTNPASEIYIESEFQGKTPLELTRDPGDVVLRLIPESYEVPLIPYETKIHLEKGVKTIVHRDFAQFQEDSAGEIVSYEKIPDKENALAVISYPDGADIKIDGNSSGSAPFQSTSIFSGDHNLTVSAQGYRERVIRFKPQNGYRLTVIAYLAKDNSNSNNSESQPPSPSPTSEEKKKPLIEILDVETGFVRVREEPSTVSAEIGRVTPGKTYELVDQDKQTQWYKIKYEDTKQGWVSNKYVKVINGLPSTPSISPVPATKTQQ